MFLDPSMKVPVQDLFRGMVVQSGNDAAWALAEGVAGSADLFVQWMNRQAQVLGMTHTVFKNPDGLPAPGQITTAGDLARLAQSLLIEFSGQLQDYALKKYHYAGTPAANDTNRNLLLFRDPNVDGLANGFSQLSLHGLVATAQREVPGLKERRLVAVVLGAATEALRDQEGQRLLNWGFSAFEAVLLFQANQPVAQVNVWKGRIRQVSLGLPVPLAVAVPSGQSSQLRSQLLRPDPVVAPLLKGQSLGSLKFYVGEQLLTERPLQVLQSVEESGVIGRAWDALKWWIK